MRAMRISSAVVGVAILGIAAPTAAGTFNSGSTGADGAFTAACTPTPCTQTVQLPASGVFHYTTYTIPANITVKYLKNATNTPVTILTTGDATIAGTLDLKGTASSAAVLWTSALSCNGGAGGPGAGSGGCGATVIPSSAGTWGAAGLGPGRGTGGNLYGSNLCGGGGGGFGAAGANGSLTGCSSGTVGQGGPAHGHASLLPLLGGSGGGGGGSAYGHTGGGGGGSVLLASSGTLTLSGTITANGGAGGAPFSNGGGGGGGSGGGVRLMATTIAGSGSASISVSGGAGGGTGTGAGGAGATGRIRLEAYTFTGAIAFGTTPSLTAPGSTTLAGTPTLSISAVGGVSAPASPGGTYGSPDITLPASTTNPVTVNLAASNIPLGITVTVRLTPQEGQASTATSTGLAGTLASSTATASVTLPLDQPAALDAEATFTLQAWLGPDAPIQYAREEVTTVRVAASLGPSTSPGARGSAVRYFTASGQEVPAGALLALGLPR